MASNINTCTVSGNLCRDSELKQTQGGTSILSFTIACNESRKNGDSWEEYPNFFNCILFGARAQALAQYLKKGTKVIVAGKLSYSSWTDNEGHKRSKVEIVANALDFAGGRQQAQQATQQQAQPAQPTYAAPAAATSTQQAINYPTTPVVETDDIPF